MHRRILIRLVIKCYQIIKTDILIIRFIKELTGILVEIFKRHLTL